MSSSTLSSHSPKGKNNGIKRTRPYRSEKRVSDAVDGRNGIRYRFPSKVGKRCQERVKKSGEEKNNSRKDAKAQWVAKKTKGFSFALLCVFATLREIVYFFTASKYLFSGARGSAWCFSILLGPVRKKR